MSGNIFSEIKSNIRVELVGENFSSACEKFIKAYKIKKLLHDSGAKNCLGYLFINIFITFFVLPFVAKNFWQEMVSNTMKLISKDAGYRFLKSPNINWRNVEMNVAKQAIDYLLELGDIKYLTAFILDDTLFKKMRSKNTELLAKAYDHVDQTYFKGFRMLNLIYSDQISNVAISSSLLSSSNEKNIYNKKIKDDLDPRCNGFKRRMEAKQHAPEVALNMLKKALEMGMTATALVFDTWFATEPFIIKCSSLINVVCMLKKNHNSSFNYFGKNMTIEEVYRNLKNKKRKKNVLGSCIVTMHDSENNNLKCKLVFARNINKKGDWIPLLSTNIKLTDDQIIKLYSIRWNIEVFHRDIKQFLDLEHGCQSNDFDALIAHNSIVLMQYNFISIQRRKYIDIRSFGELFRYFNNALEQRSFEEAFKLIMQTIIDNINILFADNEEKKMQVINAIINAYNTSIKNALNTLRHFTNDIEPRKLALAVDTSTASVV